MLPPDMRRARPGEDAPVERIAPQLVTTTGSDSTRGADISPVGRRGYHEIATSSASPEWPTPQWLVDQLAAEFGPFDTDPSATPENAKAPLFYTADDDGLSQPWKGVVWLNPPYGRAIGTWMAKARAEVANGNAERVVCLPPAKVDTQWWRDSIDAASLVRIWPRRIAFGDGSQPAPFPSAIVVFGTLPGRHGTSHKRCVICDGIYWPARADARTCSPACRQRLSRVTRAKRDSGPGR